MEIYIARWNIQAHEVMEGKELVYLDKTAETAALRLRRRMGSSVWQVRAVNRGQEKFRSDCQSERKRTPPRIGCASLAPV